MSIYCKYLVEEVHFAHQRIVPCGSSVWDSEENIVEKYFIKTDTNKENTNFSLFFQKRAEYLEMYKKGIKPKFCENCEKFVPIEYNNDRLLKYKFSKINIYNQTVCNCRCIYCCLAAFGDDKAFIKMNTEERYDIKPVLAKMEELELLEDGFELAIFGGECTVYPEELKYIVDWADKYNAKYIILSNGIVYDKTIEKLINSKNIELRISMDCGSEKTFEKIKRVKAFDKVVNNIARYSELAKNNPNAHIQLRYLLCPGINDNLRDLKDFFELALKLQVDNVVLGIERQWMQENNQKQIPIKIISFIKYYVNKNNYSNLPRGIDNSEIWDWWLEKLLSEKSLKYLLYNILMKFSMF